jgi:hypothetical protein
MRVVARESYSHRFLMLAIPELSPGAVPPVTAFGSLVRYSYRNEALERLDRMHDHPLKRGLGTQAGD